MHGISQGWMNRGNSFPVEIPTKTYLSKQTYLMRLGGLDKLFKINYLGRTNRLLTRYRRSGIWQMDC